MEAASVPATGLTTGAARPRAPRPVRPDRRPAHPAGLRSPIHDLASEGNLTRFGSNLVAGLSNGSIWALVAIGYTLVYGIVELINFAHGEVFMIGSFVSAGFFATLGLTTDTAIPILLASACC